MSFLVTCSLSRPCTDGSSVRKTTNKHTHTLSLPLPSTIVGFLLCYSQLSSYPGASDLWKLALYDGFYLTLCRDEAIIIHSVFEKLLSDSKDKKSVHHDGYTRMVHCILICITVIDVGLRKQEKHSIKLCRMREFNQQIPSVCACVYDTLSVVCVCVCVCLVAHCIEIEDAISVRPSQNFSSY